MCLLPGLHSSLHWSTECVCVCRLWLFMLFHRLTRCISPQSLQTYDCLWMLEIAHCFRLLLNSWFFSLLPHFLAHGCLMFIFMQSYSSSWVQSRRLLLSAPARMLLVIFVRQRSFQVIAALSGCVYGATCCRYCAFMCVPQHTARTSAPRGLLSKPKERFFFLKIL